MHTRETDSPVPPCRLCGGSEFKALFSAPAFDSSDERFELAECSRCGLVRTQPVLSDDQLTKYYVPSYYGGGNRKFSGVFESLIRVFNTRRARSILSIARRGSNATGSMPRVIDIGCGRGDLLRAMQSVGCECHGVERCEFPSDEQADGIRFYRGNVEDVGFEPDYFDLAVLWHVVEHLSQPLAAIGEAQRILRPGGVLAVAAPNFDGMQAPLFRSRWFHLDLPRHLHHFRMQTLQQCLVDNGFDLLSTSTCSVEQNVFGFIQSSLNAVSGPAHANALYALLKRHEGSAAKAKLIAWLVLGGLMAPLAVVESIVAAVLGKGATAIVYARKRPTG